MKIAIAAAELAVPQQWISLEKYVALTLELLLRSKAIKNDCL